MRAVCVIFVISILSVVGLALSAAASPSIVVYWQGAHAPGLNTACPEDTKTIFIAQLRVQKGERIVSYGNFKLRLKNGTDKYAEGTRVTRRLVEFYVFAGRFAKVDVAHPRRSYAYPVEVTEGANPRIRLMRTCVGTTP